MEKGKIKSLERSLIAVAGLALVGINSGCATIVAPCPRPPVVIIYPSPCPPRTRHYGHYGPAFTNPTANQGYFYGRPCPPRHRR